MEHKHVAFDVFDTVCPRFCNYLFRMMGYLYVIFGGQLLVFIAMVKLIRQDIKMGRISFIGVLKDLILTFKKRITKNYFKDIFKEMMMFFKPSFHPRQIDDQAIRNAYYLEIEELTIASP
jgi:predicted metal-dependent hydrolase